MASEYFQKLAREQKMPEPTPEMTREEKIKNWFYYYKWYLVGGAVLIWILASIIVPVITRVEPDYIFAWVGDTRLSDEAAGAFTAAVEAVADDRNGDGKTVAELRQYVSTEGDIETSLYYNYAADTRLAADMTAAESAFFLTRTPDSLQETYEIMDGEAVLLSETALILPDEFDGAYIAKRIYYDGKDRSAEEAMWKIISGAD